MLLKYVFLCASRKLLSLCLPIPFSSYFLFFFMSVHMAGFSDRELGLDMYRNTH